MREFFLYFVVVLRYYRKIVEYVLVDDAVAGVGGTALTLEGLIEPVKDRLIRISTTDLTIEDIVVNWGKTWVFGNIHSLTPASTPALLHALSMVRFFKIEFDYGYCLYRGRIPHQLLAGSKCNCTASDRNLPHYEIYNLIKHRSYGNFYMSKEQMDFHIQDVGIDPSKCHVLSSCFTSDFYSFIDPLSQRPKNNIYAIIDGQGGWHSTAKGIPDAIKLAKKEGFDYELLKTESHHDLMTALSEYKGLIFQPIIHDTCPRLVIEARLLGLELKINPNCQHITEAWWQSPLGETIEYLQSRPAFLWDTINEN